MNKLTIGLAIVASLVLSPLAVNKAQQYVARTNTYISLNEAYKAQPLPQVNLVDSADLKVTDVKRTIVLETANTVLLKGPVTEDSVSATMKKLQDVSRRVSKDTRILLILDTPGGDIFAGNELIDFADALPQKVDTLSLFSASMGFQIAQNLERRYISRSGTLMSHRASLQGMGGQVYGEFDSRYAMIRRVVDRLDVIAAARMSLDLQTYRAKIQNELWVHGFDAEQEKIADEAVLVSCGASMSGSSKQVFNTMFGPVTVTFNNCPLIKAPEAIEMGGIDLTRQAEVEAAIRMSLVGQEQFVREYITTDKFSKLFKLRLQ